MLIRKALWIILPPRDKAWSSHTDQWSTLDDQWSTLDDLTLLHSDVVVRRILVL